MFIVSFNVQVHYMPKKYNVISYSNFLVSGMNSGESMRYEEEIPDKMFTAEDLKGLPEEERE